MPICRRSVLLVTLIAVATPAACATGGGTGPASVDPEVLATLRSADSVAVMVSLVDPDVEGRGDALRAAIAGMQDAVLGSLDPGDFRVRRRFTSVPALALILTTEAALMALADHRYVQRVGLDASGGGGPGPGQATSDRGGRP